MSSMRGLTVFIADLRKCRVRELEEKRINKELANIRSKFKDPNLNGYNRKKYICKLLYVYILGWDIDFGHTEAVNLICSNKYTEKQIGYLAITLLLTENHDLTRLVTNSVAKDLDDLNEIFNCLSLQAIASIGGREMAEALAPEVLRLLMSPSSRSFVKKKAALCLLRLYRKNPDAVVINEISDRIVNLLEDEDLGVALSAASLILALSQQYPEEFEPAVEIAINIMHQFAVEEKYTMEYVYYKVPLPWLQIKLLRLLQYYPLPGDTKLRDNLFEVLQAILSHSNDIPKNPQHLNAQNAILFEAINLAIHLQSNTDLINNSSAILGRFLSSRETNLRYLSLETMTHLSLAFPSLESLHDHQNIILTSLKDKDVSIRRRALDLLFTMCDMNNSNYIVSELLRYMPTADESLREEMTLKIAIVAEKFATQYTWYMDTMIKLISIAGNQMGEEVWFRLVQLIMNHDELQEYATKMSINILQLAHPHETAIKVAAYVLGEFGHLLVDETQYPPGAIFSTLHTKFPLYSVSTKSVLLTSYLKLANLFPEIKPRIAETLASLRHSFNVEIQQRACEYYVLLLQPSDELLQTVCEEIPPFTDRESSLLNRLTERELDTEDKRTWGMSPRV